MWSQTENSSAPVVGGRAVTLDPPAAEEHLSAGVDLLCDYLTNPFGGAQQAREFLSQIDGRSLHDAELERGEFCFQIAFYFLACLAITARIDDSLVQKDCINRLYDRVRGFYARTDSTVRFSDFIVTAAERDQFAAGLGELLERSGERHGDVSRVRMTKVGMFDLVGLRRLCEYHDVMGPPDFQLTFYLVAQQLLLHHGGKRYHPSVVAVITDFLSANYGILSKIVLSGLRAGDAPTSERDAPFDPLPCDPNLPDIADKQPSRIYSAGEHVLLLVENVDPIGARGAIKFRYVLVVCERQGRSPICFVTLENSPSISNVLCVFEASGCHSNYGALRGRDVQQEFIDKGIRLIRERFDLGEIEELSTRREETSWWGFLPAAGKATVVRAPAICAGIGAEVA